MQAEALAFCCICCFFRLPSCISGTVGARCLDRQGPFCVDWCCWRSAVCFRINKVYICMFQQASLLFSSYIDLSIMCPDLALHIQWFDLLDVPLWGVRVKDVLSRHWKVGQNLCGLRVKCSDRTWEVGQHRVFSTGVWSCVNYVHFVVGRLWVFDVNNWLLPEMIRSISTCLP
jgi:hypothetical protein